MSNTEDLVKVFVDLPDDDARGAESMWAKQVGRSLYQVRNVPFYAFDLHFNDIVKAVPDGPGRKPRILRVVKPSGHKTLRVIFPIGTNEAKQVDVLSQLQPRGATYERATARMVAIDVEPEGDYQAVCDQTVGMGTRGSPVLRDGYQVGLAANNPLHLTARGRCGGVERLRSRAAGERARYAH